MSSLQQIASKFIEEFQRVNITEGFGECIESRCLLFEEFIREYLRVELESLDEVVVKNPELRENYTIHKRRVPRTIVSKVGPVYFERTYFRFAPKKSKKKKAAEYVHIVDALVGIEKYCRIEPHLCVALAETSAEQSYQKSSETICQSGVSKQSVMRIVRKVPEKESPSFEEPIASREIHLECDEDHVSLQNGRKSIVKLCCIHTKAENKGKRRYLPHRHLLRAHSQESNEDFWYRIYDELRMRYQIDSNTEIYIHGDGASWIKRGLEIIPGSQFILDKYHLMKEVRAVCAGNEDLVKCMRIAIREDSPELVQELLAFGLEEKLFRPAQVERFWNYYINNYAGVSIWRDLDKVSGGSCAEGMVSHVLSARLSGRPRAWSVEGLDAVSGLRVYMMNGGSLNSKDFERAERKQKRLKVQSKRIERKHKEYSEYLPEPSDHFRAIKHQSSLWRMYDSIKYGSYRF